MRLPTRVLYLLMMIGFIAAACSKETPDEIALDRSEIPDEVFTDFMTQESDEGRVQWRLTAPEANRFNKKKLVLLDRPTIEFFDESGKPRTKLVSDAGEYSEADRNMLAYGNVVVETIDGDVLETDSLVWNHDRNKIVSDSFVKLTRGNDVVTGIGLECNPNLTQVNIRRDVQARIIDEKGEITN